MKRKITILATFLICCSFLYGKEESYSVHVEKTSTSLDLHISSEVRVSMCPLILTGAEIQAPIGEHPGLLSLQVMTDPKGICLCAFGPHRGVFSFPPLLEGGYQLFINGLHIGNLSLENSASLTYTFPPDE